MKSYLKPQMIFLSKLTFGLTVFLERDRMAQYLKALLGQQIIACQVLMVAGLAVCRVLFSLDSQSSLFISLTFLLYRDGIFARV